jgi:hypothetical protein
MQINASPQLILLTRDYSATADFSKMSNLNKDMHARLQEAREWLQEHQEESITTASRIFQLNRTTLAYAIQKAKHTVRGGQNRILTSSQEKAIHQFIESYLGHGLLPTKGVLQAVITRLRQLENKPPPSNSWFQRWWKTQPLHKIKTKPIAKNRITAQDKDEVVSWFKRYRDVLEEHNIQRKDLWNFDETGFRIGCPKGQEIYVPLDVKEVSYYTLV